MAAAIDKPSARAGEAAGMVAVLQVQGRHIGVEGRDVVQAIVVPETMADVPRRVGGIVGVVSHNGQLLPVTHLARWMDDAAEVPAADPREARIVILRHDGRVVGLLADAVIGLRKCPRGGIERLFHDERPDELFARAVQLAPDEAPLPLLEPTRLGALAGAWCAAAEIELSSEGETTSAHAAVATTSLGVFRIGDALVGLPADAIGELLRTPALRPAPFPHPGVRGLCDWRGQLLPVVDLTAALHALPDAKPSPWLCVVREGELALGVLVHENFGLAAIESERVAFDDGIDTLVTGEVPIERGILQVVTPRALMAHCPESALSARRGAAVARAVDTRSATPFMVFEAGGVFACEVGLVQEVLPFPESVRERYAAGLPVSLSWRGHAVPVRDALAERGEPLPADRARQVIVIADGERRLAVPIAGVTAMIPSRTGTLSRLVAGGRPVTVVSTMTAEHRASYTIVDWAECLVERAPLRRAA